MGGSDRAPVYEVRALPLALSVGVPIPPARPRAWAGGPISPKSKMAKRNLAPGETACHVSCEIILAAVSGLPYSRRLNAAQADHRRLADVSTRPQAPSQNVPALGIEPVTSRAQRVTLCH